MERPRIRHRATFKERLAEEARRLKEQPNKSAPGREREVLLRKVRQAETARPDDVQRMMRELWPEYVVAKAEMFKR